MQHATFTCQINMMENMQAMMRASHKQDYQTSSRAYGYVPMSLHTLSAYVLHGQVEHMLTIREPSPDHTPDYCVSLVTRAVLPSSVVLEAARSSAWLIGRCRELFPDTRHWCTAYRPGHHPVT